MNNEQLTEQTTGVFDRTDDAAIKSKAAMQHYEAALKAAFPEGATGEVFNHWNEARKALAQPQGCHHRIADARNPIVKSGYMCIDCGALFSAADHTIQPVVPHRGNEREMNERIRELARQATGAGTLYMLEDEYLKFAELIVRECAEVAGCNGHVSGFTLGDLIKEHFGVE